MQSRGKKLYFIKSTGEVILELGEGVGLLSTTLEQDIATFTALSERNRDTFDVIELAFGEYAQDFAECNGYAVDIATKKLVFSYPDPNEPEAPPVFDKPLTEQMAELEKANADLLFENMMQDARIESTEQEQANLTFELITKGVL